MSYDKNHWLSLAPPLAPSDADVEVYKNLLGPGRVLLLGSTPKLLPLSDRALDLEPLYADPKIARGDWRENEDFFDNIIGDGVLNLEKTLCDGILEMCRRRSKVLLSRTFRRRLDAMRYASHFPRGDDFPIRPAELIERNEYIFYKWLF